MMTCWGKSPGLFLSLYLFLLPLTPFFCLLFVYFVYSVVNLFSFCGFMFSGCRVESRSLGVPPSLKSRGSVVPYPLFLLKLLIRSRLARFLPGVGRMTDGGTDFLRYYADSILTAPRAELQDAAALMEAPPPDTIDLSSGLPRFDTTSMALPRQTDRRGWPPPWGLPELRAAIAERLLVDSRLEVTPTDELLITHGATGALHTVLDTFLNRGDRAVLLDPTSPLFPLTLKTHGARVHWLCSWVEEGRLRFRLDQLGRALRGTKLLILATPSNPGGGLIAAEDLDQLVWWAERRDVLIVSDESFGRFHYENDRISPGSLARARRRTLTIGSVSKSHGLAALRVGWLAGHRHLVRPCLLSAALRMTAVSTVCQQMALSALRQSAGSFAPLLGELAARRRYAYERLHSMDLKSTWPAGGLFFWVPVWELGLSGRAFAEKLVCERRVQVTPGDLFGPSGAGYVRISFAVDDGRLREGLSRLSEFLRNLQGTPVKQPQPPLAA
jgi:aspartate/methionine/tyrosine aminotransferase